MENKTLFDAVDAELRNARAALNNAGVYMDTIKNTMREMEKSPEIEVSLPVSRGKPFTDLLVKTESGGYGIPLTIDTDDETLMYGFEIRTVNNELKEYLKLL